RIVALVAGADRFLGREVLPGLGERGLLRGELLLQDRALALARAGTLLGRFLREAGACRCLGRGRDIHLARDRLALQLFGLVAIVGVGPLAVRAFAFPDFGGPLCVGSPREKGGQNEGDGSTNHELSLSNQRKRGGFTAPSSTHEGTLRLRRVIHVE